MKIDSWQFHKGDLGGIWESIRPVTQGAPEDALQWEDVILPHCFNGKDALNPDENYYQGPGWYRTIITIDNPYMDGITLLHFEGAGQITDVYLDDKYIDTHIGGYDEWSVNLTHHLSKTTKSFILSIRCDNSRNLEIIPSDLADFNIYGGLYRNVNLIYEPNIYLEDIHLTPIYNDENENGILNISARFNKTPLNLGIEVLIYEKHNLVLSLENEPISTEKFKTIIKFDSVKAWTPDSPVLYMCKIKWIMNEQIFSKENKFGFRNFEFKKHGPFYLNGKRLLLKGTHRHEDHAGVGAAQSVNSIKKEMLMIKEMGANFIRLGHYQQCQQVLNLCDELGFLVWEEIPWCRGGIGGKGYKSMGKRMLKNMINQHYNHPSIILWGLGNENDWPGDFSTFDKQEIRNYMSNLNRIAHELDSTRKTSIRRCDFCKDIIDIYSPSIWAGWYRGHYKEYKKSTIEHINGTDRFLHVEWGADSHANRFCENPYIGLENLKMGIGTDERDNDASLFGGITRVSRDGNWSENYACDLFDWTLKEQLEIQELTGTAFWPFKDFSTPLRGDNPIPYVNQKGVVQRDLTKKEVYYVVQSYWGNKPMIRLFGHGWKIRSGDELEKKEFKVYSNCQKVEFFLDGKSLGIKSKNIKKFPCSGFTWDSVLTQGKHTIKAIAFADGITIEDGYDFYYQIEKWGEPSTIKSQFIKNKNNKLIWEIEVVDSKGLVCLDFSKRVRFSATEKSPLITEMGTATGSREIECANGRSSISLKYTNESSVISAYIEGLPMCFTKYPPENLY